MPQSTQTKVTDLKHKRTYSHKDQFFLQQIQTMILQMSKRTHSHKKVETFFQFINDSQ